MLFLLYLTPPSKYISRYWLNASFISISSFRRYSDGSALNQSKIRVSRFFIRLTHHLVVDRIFQTMGICRNRHHDYNHRVNSLCQSITIVMKVEKDKSKQTSLSFWILSGWSTEERRSSQRSGTISIRFDKFRSTWCGGNRRIKSRAQSSWWSCSVNILKNENF